ncbi:universal stress protein [Nocardia otitidiscaviarum]|uniref:universal stress protein n=1 Tax=Nocardia otitidiscaviarum TaxID=1823 RepID=UPI00069428A9|nr:universal stress protein [Nocardia otitidiscaviarum]MBF6137328.1 universal stress protein [Nocardia otitidiscaviarum]MBF6241051.1 universal stress protein [Nocardia otitidiscaviarum]MBF6488410.1 universal stress protein [Nocardia otitidiscaviarum]
MADNSVPATDRGATPIIVAVDGSEISYQAVKWAAVEADLRRAPLHIITSYAVPTGRGSRTGMGAAETAWLRSDGARVLGEASTVAHATVPGESITVSTEFTFDPIIPTLMRLSADAAMIVVGNRGRGAVRRALLGSVSTAISRRAQCPVAVVHGVSETDADAARLPVVVGVDGTENSQPAIEMACEEASRRKVGLLAVHAWGETNGYDLPVVGWTAIHETEAVLLGQGMAGFAERYPEVPMERVVVCDTPVRALLNHADKAQLLVVGTHGRGGFPGMLIGSTSTALLQHAQCPVLVVRHDTKMPDDPGVR